MERVCFLLEETGQRLSCLLNPDSIVIRREAGVRTRATLGGRLTGAALSDDPLLFTGGGRTELELDLLFDTSLVDGSIQVADVQDLTRPLWSLAESTAATDGAARLRRVRLVWGKAWNIEGVVTAVAERLERFDVGGAPQRAWLRMRLLRTAAAQATSPVVAQPPAGYAIAPDAAIDEDLVLIHEVVGDPSTGGERLDLIAAMYYGEPAMWRVLAAYNGIADPTRIPPPATLRIPPLSAVRSL
jgi:hypothetical protein